jgi:flagellar protein FliS
MNEFTYKRAAIEGASSAALVIMLYDRLIADIQRAIAAMQQNDIEARCSELKHALLILQQLEGSLDHEHGGTAARNLAAFYSYARAKVLEAQIKMDPAMLRKLIAHFQDVKGAWQQADAPSEGLPASEAPPVRPRPRAEGESLLSCTV